MADARSGQRRIIRGCFISGVGLLTPLLSLIAREAWWAFIVPLVPIGLFILSIGVSELIRGIVELVRSPL